jgi:hypothetical protein
MLRGGNAVLLPAWPGLAKYSFMAKILADKILATARALAQGINTPRSPRPTKLPFPVRLR